MEDVRAQGYSTGLAPSVAKVPGKGSSLSGLNVRFSLSSMALRPPVASSPWAGTAAQNAFQLDPACGPYPSKKDALETAVSHRYVLRFLMMMCSPIVASSITYRQPQSWAGLVIGGSRSQRGLG